MSNVVFPSLPGLQFDIVKQPMFNTKVQRAVSGKEYRAAFMQYPLYTFTLAYDLLRDAAAFQEFQKLLGFFNARQGSFDSFLFLDATDSAAASQNFGTGTGTATAFPLRRTYGAGGFTANDLVQNVLTITSVFDGTHNVPPGAGAGNYTVDSVGTVTFGTAPGAGNAITWNGTYYYRCRFVADTLDFNQFMNGLWELKQLQFIGSPQNKV